MSSEGAVPHEELLANGSDQQDEETALSSIFPNEFRRLEHDIVYSVDSPEVQAGSKVPDDGASAEDIPLFERYTSSRLECAYEFQLMIPPDTSTLQIYLDEGSSVPPEVFSSSSPDFEGLWAVAGDAGRTDADDSTLSRVEFLPPIVLRWRCPASYPSRSPPVFSLTCEWLHPSQIAKASRDLDAMWEDGKGAGIIFTWQQYLAAELLPALDLEGTVLIQYWSAGDLPLGPRDDREEAEGVAVAAGAAGGRLAGGGDGGDEGAVRRDEEAGGVEEGEWCAREGEETGAAWAARLRLLERLRMYDATMRVNHFYAEAHVCELCMESRAGGDFAWLGCKHFFCNSCLRSMAEMHVQEGSIENLRCPDTACRQPIEAERLFTLLPAEAFQRWQKMHRKKELESTPGVAFCPRCDPSVQLPRGRPACRNLAEAGFCKYGDRCNFAHSPEEMQDAPLEPVPCLPTSKEDDLYVCPRCRFNFCGGCLDPWHPGTDCVSSAEKSGRMEARIKYLETAGRDTKRAVERMKMEMLSERKVTMISTACPGCKMPIEKTGGCNHMTCASCLTHFCWKCKKVIPSSDPYSHFGGGCTVFSDEDVRDAHRRERLANHPNLHRRVMQAFGVEQQNTTCPNCRAQAVKDASGNNHVTCWNCSVPFCFLCRQRLRGTHGHFKPGHPQHSGPEETRRIQETILPRAALQGAFL